MRKAARTPSDCTSTRDLPGYRPGLRPARPLYCSLPRRLPMLVTGAAASSPASGRNPRNFSHRPCNLIGSHPDLPTLGLHRPSGLYRRWWSRPAAGVQRERHRARQGTSSDTIEVRNEGRTDIVVRHIVIEPGGSTGWHYHRGALIAVVHKGTLTRTLEDCSVQVSSAGQSLVEAAGDTHAHSGRSLGTEPVELYVTYVIGRCSAVHRRTRSWLRIAGRAVSRRTGRLRVAAGRACPLPRCSRP
jgi:quercetin dioxygenase-like cupin family protein